MINDKNIIFGPQDKKSTIRTIRDGAGSLIITPNMPHRKVPTDVDAIRSDWKAVGGDFRRALNDLKKHNK